MRIRLLLDTDLTRAQIEHLQMVIDEQPEAAISSQAFPEVLGARLMGAAPIEVE
jgi:hypothetical protein